MERRRILVIAGSDSSGGAGLEADQKVIAHHECYAMTATTALTAQNTQGVSDIYTIPSDFVVKQIDAVCDDIGIDAVKIGMLASAATVDAVADALKRHTNSHTPAPIVVLDPVMVSTSGAKLLPDDAVQHLLRNLLPLSTFLTPNVPEALLLATKAGGPPTTEIQSIHDMVQLAQRIQKLGPKYVLLKGGHQPISRSNGRTASPHEQDKDKLVVNVLHDGERAFLLVTDYVSSRNTHGTGCSLASAIAANMVFDPATASERTRPDLILGNVQLACQYVEHGIREAVDVRLGQGNGPIAFFTRLRLHEDGNGRPASHSTLRVREYDGPEDGFEWLRD